MINMRLIIKYLKRAVKPGQKKGGDQRAPPTMIFISFKIRNQFLGLPPERLEPLDLDAPLLERLVPELLGEEKLRDDELLTPDDELGRV
jgi:hypothetical protein